MFIQKYQSINFRFLNCFSWLLAKNHLSIFIILFRMVYLYLHINSFNLFFAKLEYNQSFESLIDVKDDGN